MRRSGSTQERENVLIIDDDPELSEVIAINLRDMGFAASRAADGRTGLRRAIEEEFALVILDVMLPVVDGFSVCASLRQEKPGIPILMLTARSEDSDRIRGLDKGADDYITKPFSVKELMARVKALLRRVKIDKEGAGSIAIGDLALDLDKRKVSLSGRDVDLTAKEFELLRLFARNPGRIYPRAELLTLVWGSQFDGFEHTVNSHINRLRGKIEADPGNPRYLKTVWGIGYRFAEPAGVGA
jgi:two-component system alkaline phosphatase synthesis response regulator PhoP